MTIQNSFEDIFAKNRAEELGYDVWSHFVIPPFFGRLNLHSSGKPSIIVGGRGCGKTMLLRYLSHKSTFSPTRSRVPDEALSRIGVYWRTDTQFANAMVKRDVADDTWEAAFNHMATLFIGIEVLDSLCSIEASKPKRLTKGQINKLDFSRLRAFHSTLPPTFLEFRNWLEEQMWSFEAWVNDVRKGQGPTFLPGLPFIQALIREIQRQVPLLKDSVYMVYIDEYENLTEYQQKIINTWLKHSETPLIFNLAMKKYGFGTRKTTGPESLSNIHDFREHDLEEHLREEGFELFAAEILFLTLTEGGMEDSPVSVEMLQDPNNVAARKNPEYTKRVLAAAQRLFPDVGQDALANSVFQDNALSQKLRKRIHSALQRRQAEIKTDRLFRPELSQASIIVPALLNRKDLEPSAIEQEMENLAQGIDNRFTGKTDWIHNNFIGCLLQLYEPHSRACPFYAGFKTFSSLSSGNIRHFLELCHKSLSRSLRENKTFGVMVDPSQQAEAARQASTAFLGEIKSFGRFGNRLHAFVLRLGSLFALAHQRPTQSETEQSHFSIVRGALELAEDHREFLREAVKWSVVFEEAGTKRKDSSEPENIDYVLNPIYAPYFHISYRKKRRLELSAVEFITMVGGTYDDVRNLLRGYSARWNVQSSDKTPTLFSHLEDE